MNVGHFSEQDVLNLARKAYAQGNAAFDIVPNKCALLVIDMQDEFLKPHWSPDWVPEATRQVPRIKRLIEHCRNKCIPVIFTVYSRTHQYLDRPKTGRFMPGSCLSTGRSFTLKVEFGTNFLRGAMRSLSENRPTERSMTRPWKLF